MFRELASQHQIAIDLITASGRVGKRSVWVAAER
jgi:hypothetical protein